MMQLSLSIDSSLLVRDVAGDYRPANADEVLQDRAVALEQARQVAVHARAAEVRNRFHGAGTPYTPSSINFYGN